MPIRHIIRGSTTFVTQIPIWTLYASLLRNYTYGSRISSCTSFVYSGNSSFSTITTFALFLTPGGSCFYELMGSILFPSPYLMHILTLSSLCSKLFLSPVPPPGIFNELSRRGVPHNYEGTCPDTVRLWIVASAQKGNAFLNISLEPWLCLVLKCFVVFLESLCLEVDLNVSRLACKSPIYRSEGSLNSLCDSGWTWFGDVVVSLVVLTIHATVQSTPYHTEHWEGHLFTSDWRLLGWS